MSEAFIFATSASIRFKVGKVSRAAPHQHDPLDDVVFIVLPGNPEARHMPDADRGDIADQHGNIVVLRDNGVGDVVHRVNQPDAAHDRRLRTDSKYWPPTLMLPLFSACRTWDQ